MYELKDIFKKLSIPLGLVAVIVAALAMFGLTLEQLVAVAVSLVGLQLLQSFFIDLLKWVGVVDDNAAGKWSAVFNLATLLGVGAWLKLFPTVDIYAIDKQIFELSKVLVYVFAYVTQIIGTKQWHASIGFKSYSSPL